MRRRLVQVLTAAAIGMGAGMVVGTVPPAGADLAPAQFWCTAYKPHAADTVTESGWIWLDSEKAIGRCKAQHTEQGMTGPIQVKHCYYVTVFANGSSEWDPSSCPNF